MTRLPPEWHALISAGASHRIGSGSRDGQPAISRALAADVLDDGRILVLLDREAGFEVVQAVEQTGQVALVLGLPMTHRTLHLKGSDGVVAAAGPDMQPLLRARCEAFIAQIVPFGFSPEAVSKFWYDVPAGQLVSITFTINGAWDQTPGPGAGRAVELRP